MRFLSSFSHSLNPRKIGIRRTEIALPQGAAPRLQHAPVDGLYL